MPCVFIFAEYLFKYILNFRWDSSVEKAWLSLFRFIEFWMGLSYTETDKVHQTLESIKEDPRLPGGQIDTEFVLEESQGRPKTRREVLAEMMAAEPESSSDKSDYRIEVEKTLPQWLQDIDLNSRREKHE